MADVRDIQMNFTANTSQADAAIQRLKGSTDQASKSLDKQKTSTVNAGGAVISFGRIIQDAPFGIIGVANNITMLSEQFVSLKQQAGGASQALKAMMSGVMGPMGFTLAISAITTALQFWALQSNKTKKAIDALGDSVKRLVEFKNPFENFVLKFDTKNIDKAISQIKYELGVATTKVTSLTGSPNAEEMLDPAKLANRAGQSYLAQKQFLPRIEVLKKTLEYLQTIKKEVDMDSRVFQTLNEFMKSGLESESDKPFKFGGSDEPGKVTAEKINELNKSIIEAIKTDDLLGRLTSQSNFTLYLKQLSEELAKYKEGTAEFNNVLETMNMVKKRESLVAQMRNVMAGEDSLKMQLRWGDQQSFWAVKGLQGISGADIAGIERKPFFPEMRDEINLDMVNDKNNLLIREGAKQAKAQYAVYKDYFIDPFTEAFRGEFSKAWQSIFGEANSLLEKFIQSLGESLFNKAVGSAASGILGMIFPGFNLLEAAVGGFGGGGDRATVNQIVIDGELIATQKQATRIKAQLDRQASLR